jgi:hypothetical protein
MEEPRLAGEISPLSGRFLKDGPSMTAISVEDLRVRSDAQLAAMSQMRGAGSYGSLTCPRDTRVRGLAAL